MTRDEILAMEPGPKLDALVAEKVMEWEKRYLRMSDKEYWYSPNSDDTVSMPWVDDWSPSTNISAAWEAEAKAIEKDGQEWAAAVTTILGIDNWILSSENIKRIARMSAAERSKAALLAGVNV